MTKCNKYIYKNDEKEKNNKDKEMDIEKIMKYDNSHPHKISYRLCEYMCKKLIDTDHRDFRKDAMVKILKESMDEIGFKNGIVHLTKEIKKEKEEEKKNKKEENTKKEEEKTKYEEKKKEENIIIVRDDEEERKRKNMEIEKQMKKGVNPIFLEQFKNAATTYNIQNIQRNEYHVHIHGTVPSNIIESIGNNVGQKRQRSLY